MFKFDIIKAANIKDENFPFTWEGTMNIKVKKVLDNAQLPVKGSDGAAGYDVFAATETFRPEKTGPIFEYDTGLAFEVPKGYGMFILPRSGITTKTSFILGPSVGLLDPDYRGTLKFQFRNVSPGTGKKYNVGDKIGQIVVLPVPELNFEVVEELSDTKRGEGGFGSTGK